MKAHYTDILAGLIALVIVAAACIPPTQTPTPTPASADQCVTFDTLALNTQIGVGAGVFADPAATLNPGPFTPPGGVPTSGGFARLENGGRSGGSGQEAQVNNITLNVDYGATLVYLRLSFGEYGGNLNLTINDEFANFGNFAEVDGTLLGGVKIHVLSGGQGNDTGEIEFEGEMRLLDNQLGQFAIGGQELWLDNLCAKLQ